MTERAAFPHCDTRVLHTPGECQYCDEYPDWQKIRNLWGIAFTGQEPQEVRVTDTLVARELPCPADFNRPQGGTSDHRQWPGNTARPSGTPSPTP